MVIDLDELETELRKMKPRQKLFELVRRVLLEQGRWKNAPRGWIARTENVEMQPELEEEADPWGPIDR